MNTTETFSILVVDDEEEIRSLIKDVLSRRNHQIFEASNGKIALDIVQKNKINIVISDIRMPEMGGLELFNQLKPKRIPVILMTGYAKDFDVKRAEELGAADYLSKPFSTEDLINSIELVIHQLQSGRDENDEIDLDHDYCRVHIDDFITGSKANQDLFLRLSHDKYLRIAKHDSPLSAEKLLSYKKKGLHYLYIKKEDFANYVGFNLKLAQTVRTTRNPIPRKQKLQLIRQTSEVYLENILINGVDQESFQMGKAFVETAVHMVTEADNIFEMIEMLRKSSDVSYAHSLGVSLYASLMAKAVGWVSASTLFKVSMAGLLHDIGKKEIPRRILLKTRIEMTPEEIQLYETHPVRGKDLLAQVACVPEEVIQATLQHHENIAGLGFPYRTMRSKIHPFARIIGVANEFCHIALKGPTGDGLSAHESIARILQLKENEFDPVFIRALMEIFKFPVPEKYQRIRMFMDTENPT